MRRIFRTIWHGIRLRCPRCGEGKIFESWGLLHEHCPECQLNIRSREFDTWFFMYMSTAGITGLFVIVMFLFTPQNVLIGKIAVMGGAIVVFFGTQPSRKGFAIAVDYLLDSALKRD